MPTSSVRLAIDIGGTFTDLEFVDEGSGRSGTFKSPTTPQDPSIGLMNAIQGAARQFGFDVAEVTRLLHGTTIATNAVLTRDLPAAALVTTKGFEDVLEIGRHARTNIYRLEPETPVVLVPRHRRFGFAERIAADGSVLTAPTAAEIGRVVDRVLGSGVKVVAICLLNAFLDPRHEVILRDALLTAAPDLLVSCSHEISPEIREFERTSTTVLNALLLPVVRGYLTLLQERRALTGFEAPLYLVQSNGGAATVQAAMDAPARLLLSGPSGGALAAELLANQLGLANVVAVDMGGTSYDVSLVQDGRRAIVTSGDVDGCPVRLPMVEMRTIGAGGGSIVYVDAGGRLQVGPRSAGAWPGPACYGRGGTEPTVTDANVVLGRLDPATFASSGIHIDLEAARAVLDRNVASRLGLGVDALAEGVLKIVVAKFATAIKLSLFERGLDPKDYALMSFGGAGGLHAVETAQELGMRTVVFPRNPSTFSAHGILQSDIVHDLAVSRILPLEPSRPAEIAAMAVDLRKAGVTQLSADGILSDLCRVELSADLRYAGQAFELPVPLPEGNLDEAALADLAERFHRMHEQRFSFSNPGDPVELVTLRASATGRLAAAAEQRAALTTSVVEARHRPMHLDGMSFDIPVIAQGSIGSGETVVGPVLVEQAYTTLFLPAGWTMAVTATGDLVASEAP